LCPEDATPYGARNAIGSVFYKYAAPTALVLENALGLIMHAGNDTLPAIVPFGNKFKHAPA
jgi:hypothetical protein